MPSAAASRTQAAPILCTEALLLLDRFPKDLFSMDLFSRESFKPAREARALAARLLPMRESRPVEVAGHEVEPRTEREPTSDELLTAISNAVPTSEDSMSDVFLMEPIDESPRLSRAQMMTRIIELNPSASIDYLARFDDEALGEYLSHIDTASDPRRARVGWQRKNSVPAVAFRESL